MNKNTIRKIVLCAVLGTVATMSAGCGDKVFPVSDIPDILKETYSPSIAVSNNIERSMTTSDDSVTRPNDVLADNKFNIYFDNTTGCFMGYINAREKDADDIGYQMFAKTMTSFWDTFNCTGSYRTFTLQPDDKKILFWNEYTENIFTNFANISAYTENSHAVFADNEAPVTMWLNEVQKGFSAGDDTVSVYISDLNEQNGLLSQTGNVIKNMLLENPEKDFLIISYVLPYKGEISAPTFGNEGNNKSQVESERFSESINRNYYTIAFGEHDTLNALKNKVQQGFSEINLDMTAYMYRDMFYTENEVRTADKNGNVIESENFISENPPVIRVIDENGNIISGDEEPEETEDNNDLFGGEEESDGKGLRNLKKCGDYTEFFSEEPLGETFIYKNTIPDTGSLSAEISLKLENPDIYDFDFENASVYTYANGDASEFTENAESGWIPADGMNDSIWNVSYIEDTVKVSLSDTLTADTTPALVVSVPVKFQYTQEKKVSSVININPEFRSWVENCKTPDIINDENKEEKYAKTYGFDSFIDKITGYKAMTDGENKTSEAPETTSDSCNVCRVNLILVADEEK